ncbi:lipid-A-disaccharide synthase [Gloeocapsopsis crepidinum LEGE 06123]|uniref:Lipid-A-disaccharide synthase n=1 Tax=Gloeocapsopsis crepidinum LEGE 06123 TaxID=588587 RepID=A0ABR9UN04_9CHRO|nr:lipid-A-disaccharide synthase [Gloeocapsopsis crepidinum]MBE9189418.1 lipid-A-disaccharide synthase [Gloeocapsopsis crepidinum LEGE 06123]
MRSQGRRIFISTGEVAGDLQGALLIEALKRQAARLGWELNIVALGGEKMAAAGATVLGDTSSIGSVGIFESLPFVLPTLQLQKRAIANLKQHPPDLVVLIDYAQPNLNIGSYLHRELPNVPIVYYIAPQVWVWAMNSRNTEQIVKITDKVLAIFPEEARYFEQNGGKVVWVGHPLVDRMQTAPSRDAARAALGIPPEQTAIALLPASRRQEIKYLLPVMLQAAKTLQEKLPQVHFWIPLSLEIYRRPIEQAITRYGLQATLRSSQTLEILAAADLAITKSGTVNLEIALLNVPQVVIYRVSPITAWIARHILKFSIPFMSPPNLVEMKSIVPELPQEQATPENIVQNALDLLLDPSRRQQILADYQQMRRAVGEVGVCDRAAQEILQMLPR